MISPRFLAPFTLVFPTKRAYRNTHSCSDSFIKFSTRRYCKPRAKLYTAYFLVFLAIIYRSISLNYLELWFLAVEPNIFKLLRAFYHTGTTAVSTITYRALFESHGRYVFIHIAIPFPIYSLASI